LAKKLWKTTDVLGRRIQLPGKNQPWMTVVGVAADTRVDGLTEPAPPIMYFPHSQSDVTGYFTSLSMGVLVRATNAEALVPEIRRAVRDLDSKVPMSDVRTMHDIVAASIAQHRFTSMLLTGLALFAVLLAALGVYGVTAYAVAERRYEFGVRAALGAQRRQVLMLVLRGGLGMTLMGLGIGMGGVFVLGRLLRGMLAGIGTIDAPVLVAVVGVLLVVSTAALIVPARRALAVDPTEALRS
jgi:ABC-type antimicrobial peptide transport system permease subunit